MDIYCPRCGEPCELDYIQQDMTDTERKDFLAGRGCSACKGHEVKDRPFRADAAGALLDVCGDDLDGVAAELEDIGF